MGISRIFGRGLNGWIFGHLLTEWRIFRFLTEQKSEWQPGFSNAWKIRADAGRVDLGKTTGEPPFIGVMKPIITLTALILIANLADARPERGGARPAARPDADQAGDRREKLQDLTPEQKEQIHERVKGRLESLTPEQREKLKERIGNRVSSLTPEQKERIQERIRNATPENKERIGAALRERMKEMTPEQKEAFLKDRPEARELLK